MDKHATSKEIIILQCKLLREPWMTNGLQASGNKNTNMYRRSIGMPKDSLKYIQYIAYRNKYNQLKHKAKIHFYQSKVNDYRHDS